MSSTVGARSSAACATLRMNRGRNPWNLARSYLSGVPLSIERNRSDEMAQARASGSAESSRCGLRRRLADGAVPAGRIRRPQAAARAQRRVCDLGAAGRLEGNALRKALVQREAGRVRRVRDRRCSKRFDVVFAVSAKDRERCLKSAPTCNERACSRTCRTRSLLELPPLSFAETEPGDPVFRDAELAAEHRRACERFIT